MATTGAARAKEKEIGLPKSATIAIREQHPHPHGEVEVTPDGGRVHFHNKDKKEYRLRLWRPKTDPNTGIDLLLPASGRVTVVIKKRDEYFYNVMNIDADIAETGNGGGPIRN